MASVEDYPYVIFRKSAFISAFIALNCSSRCVRFIGILGITLDFIFSVYVRVIYYKASLHFSSLIKVHVSTMLGTAPELIAVRYFCTTITYYFPVILLWFEVNLNSLRVDFILFRNYILWLTNSGLNSSIGIWSRFWSLF